MIQIVLKILIAITLLILFGIAGEWDYQDHKTHQEQTIQY